MQNRRKVQRLRAVSRLFSNVQQQSEDPKVFNPRTSKKRSSLDRISLDLGIRMNDLDGFAVLREHPDEFDSFNSTMAFGNLNSDIPSLENKTEPRSVPKFVPNLSSRDSFSNYSRKSMNGVFDALLKHEPKQIMEVSGNPSNIEPQKIAVKPRVASPKLEKPSYARSPPTKHESKRSASIDESFYSKSMPTTNTRAVTCENVENWSDEAIQEYIGINGRGVRAIGSYSPDARVKRIKRFKVKRSQRCWKKRVSYTVRKLFAESRMRVKGRFVKKSEARMLMAE
eukprot:TRINITY_DN780070_c0_g1_i1.p1 TRINITY_DN780070_c0_g1~~TRINITY_DN780070_c0_g1_i1.p1  ORF type:complete len:298 (-),score=47.88 TRINITY_DN780070_c0_g1_i1:334-1182(-)